MRTSSVEQIRWILADSGAVAVFAGDARCAEGIAAAQAPKVEAVWQIDGGGLDALARTGEGVTAGETGRRRAAVTALTLATIVYTSGTTGRPKGCMISHGNLTGAVRAITGVPGVRERVLTEGSSSLFFLPLSHILARVVALCLVHAGKRIGFLSDPGELPAELAAFRPTILLAVPRVFEKVAAAAREQAEAEGHQRLFAAAEAAAIAYSRAGHRAGMLLRLRHAVFGRLVYARLRAALGGQAAWAISGGAPLNQELGHFLSGAGITIMDGWGLTETVGPVTMNRPEVQRIGSVGLPLPGCAVRIAADLGLTPPGGAQWHRVPPVSCWPAVRTHYAAAVAGYRALGIDRPRAGNSSRCIYYHGPFGKCLLPSSTVGQRRHLRSLAVAAGSRAVS